MSLKSSELDSKKDFHDVNLEEPPNHDFEQEDTHENPEDLEPKTRRRKRMQSIAIVNIALFSISLGTMVVMTGTLPYLERLLPSNDDEDDILTKYGFIVGANPLGQMFFTPFYGWLVTKRGSIRATCLFGSVLFTVSNLICAILSVFQEKNRFWIFFVARLLTGVASAIKAPFRTYIAQSTYTSERTSHMAIMGATQTLGIIIGPLMQSALTAVGCVDHTGDDRYFTMDTYTLANWVGVILGVVSTLLLLPYIFTEYDVTTEEKKALIAKAQSSKTDDLDMSLLKPDYLVVCIIIGSYFFYIFNFAVLETLGTPICMDQFGWSESDTLLYLGIAMASGGVISICTLMVLRKLVQRFDERYLLFAGVFVMMVSKLVMFPLPGNDYPPLPPTNQTKINDFTDNLLADLSNPASWPHFLGQSRSEMGARDAHEACETTSADGGSSYCDYDWCEDQKAIAEWQFFLGYALTFAGFPFLTTIPSAILTKVLGPRPQGVWLGLTSTLSSLSRVVSPMILTLMYTARGNYLCIGFISLATLIAFFLQLTIYPRLIPMKTRVENARKREEILKQT